MEIIITLIVLGLIGLIVRAAMGGEPATYPGRQLRRQIHEHRRCRRKVSS